MRILQLILVLLLVLLLSCRQQAPPPTSQHFEPSASENPSTAPQDNKVEISMTAKDFAFEPAEIRVKQGDRVVLKVKSLEGHHGLAINTYGVSADLPQGVEQTLEFTADKKGTFGFYCNVPCGSGHRGMQGNLIVE